MDNQNKKFKKDLNEHKILTRLIADGKITSDNEQALACQKITGEELALYFADFKCECCKQEHDLQIHHLISRINKDIVPSNKYLSQRRYFFNLVILCNKCHNKIHGFSSLRVNATLTAKIDETKKRYGVE